MHDIDRTQLEYSPEMEAEGFEFGEYGEFGEAEYGEFGEFGEFGEYGEYGEYGEFGEAEAGVLSEAQEVQLASELLAVTNEAELNQFLGSLIGSAAKAIGPMLPQLIGEEAEQEQFLGSLIKRGVAAAGKFARSSVGQAIGGALKGIAKKALPLAGGALGAWVGGPLGAKIGSGLASAAGKAIGLEAEMSQEDREFEGARNFVRLGTQTVKNIATKPITTNPRAAAQAAVAAAARQIAPGLLGRAALAGLSRGYGAGYGRGYGRAPAGRWMRRGNKIVLYGV
jgi:hypothetical protein